MAYTHQPKHPYELKPPIKYVYTSIYVEMIFFNLKMYIHKDKQDFSPLL